MTTTLHRTYTFLKCIHPLQTNCKGQTFTVSALLFPDLLSSLTTHKMSWVILYDKRGRERRETCKKSFKNSETKLHWKIYINMCSHCLLNVMLDQRYRDSKYPMRCMKKGGTPGQPAPSPREVKSAEFGPNSKPYMQKAMNTLSYIIVPCHKG